MSLVLGFPSMLLLNIPLPRPEPFEGYGRVDEFGCRDRTINVHILFQHLKGYMVSCQEPFTDFNYLIGRMVDLIIQIPSELILPRREHSTLNIVDFTMPH